MIKGVHDPAVLHDFRSSFGVREVLLTSGAVPVSDIARLSARRFHSFRLGKFMAECGDRTLHNRRGVGLAAELNRGRIGDHAIFGACGFGFDLTRHFRRKGDLMGRFLNGKEGGIAEYFIIVPGGRPPPDRRTVGVSGRGLHGPLHIPGDGTVGEGCSGSVGADAILFHCSVMNVSRNDGVNSFLMRAIKLADAGGSRSRVILLPVEDHIAPIMDVIGELDIDNHLAAADRTHSVVGSLD